MGVRAGNLDFVFLSYDEPNAPMHWEGLRALVPHAKHVQGVKGLASAFRRAGEMAETEHFFTIDADTRLRSTFLEHAIDDDKINAERVISWPSCNIVNGLTYGHGGVKCWSRRMVREDATRDDEHIDHVLNFEYIFEPRSFSTCHPNPTPLHAFRAGFREGARLPLVRGHPAHAERLCEEVHETNRQRLQVWCSLGRDVDHGAWCILGARMGCVYTLFQDLDLALLADFDQFRGFFDDHVMPQIRGTDRSCPITGLQWSSDSLAEVSQPLGERLRELGLAVVDLEPAQSAFIKQIYNTGLDLGAFDMLGNLHRSGQGLPRDPAKAAEQYRIGAGLGHSNAMNNLARLHLQGSGVARDEDYAATLLWQASALGNPFAPQQLARLRLKGSQPDIDAAIALLDKAAARGFRQADLELGQIFADGTAVRKDVVRALCHFILAGEMATDAADNLAARLTPDVIAVAQAQATAKRSARQND